MKKFRYKPSRMLILLTAMAVLLPLLAALQYSWLGQVSEGATERLQSNLRANAKAFRQDFNREFIRAYLNFHMDSFAPPTAIESYHTELFEHWNKTAPYPRLIKHVFLAQYDERGVAQLKRLNAPTKQFEAIDWPEDLKGLREQLVRGDGSHLLATGVTPRSLESFEEDIPALVVPFPSPTNQSAQSLPLPPGFTIVQLDLNYLQQKFIPTLVRRHLFESHTEYDVAVTSLRNPGRQIYSSSDSVTDFASSDVSTRIFRMEADELRAFVNTEAVGPEGLASGQTTAPRPRLLNLRFFKRSVGGATAPATSDEDGRWQLSIKHRSGSLAAVVNSARRRNLAISFGILLLLGAGILITAVSTRRAERLAQQQINFVAGVTHELRTPLAVICSAGENLAHGIIAGPEKVAQYGEVIHREGKRLTDMVEQVLEFAGAQSGRPRYEFRATDVAQVIDEAIAACQAQIQERHFKLETSFATELPAVHGDAAALRRAMQNLISNAIKYAGNKGRAAGAQISAQASSENKVMITIADRGLGINSADVSHIFEPFYRGREALASQIEGSGVGLSLVKQIIDAHGGRITVKSTPGAGSTFTLYLPANVQTPGKSVEA